MVFTLQTLYKTPTPDHVIENPNSPEDFSSAEFRELAIEREADSEGVVSYVFSVFQGWWDEAERKPKPEQLPPLIRVPYVSLAAAEEAYHAQLKSLVKQGYIYSFVPMPPNYPPESRYRVLKEDDENL